MSKSNIQVIMVYGKWTRIDKSKTKKGESKMKKKFVMMLLVITSLFVTNVCLAGVEKSSKEPSPPDWVVMVAKIMMDAIDKPLVLNVLIGMTVLMFAFAIYTMFRNTSLYKKRQIMTPLNELLIDEARCHAIQMIKECKERIAELKAGKIEKGVDNLEKRISSFEKRIINLEKLLNIRNIGPHRFECYC